MTQPRIELEFMGSDADGGHLRLTGLVNELLAVRDALLETERLYSHSTDSKIIYRVVRLSHASPTRVTLEAAPEGAEQEYVDAVVRLFNSSLQGTKLVTSRAAEASRGASEEAPNAADLGLGDQGQMGGD